MKNHLLKFLLGSALLGNLHAQTCNVKVNAPVLTKPIKIHAVNVSDTYLALNVTGVIGQSFKSNAPYLSNIKLYLTSATEKQYKLALYRFGSLSGPKGNGVKMLEQTFTVAANATEQIVTFPMPIYAKAGTQYYVEITPVVATDAINTFKSQKNVIPEGNIFINNTFNQLIDLKIEVNGGFPGKGHDPLPVLDYYSNSEKDGNNNYILWNATSNVVGQTFLATTSLLKSVSINTGNSSGIAEANVYEVNEVTGEPYYNKISQACRQTINSFNKTTFDWAAQNLALPYLKVGKKYYIEFKPITNTSLHVYGWISDVYQKGNSFFNGQIRGNGQDLNVQIFGIEPNITFEKVYAVQTGGSNASPVNGSRIGQVFKASTHYLTSFTANGCNTGAVNLNLYEYSGSVAAPRGKLITTLNNTTFNNCGITYIQLVSPLKVDFGKDYYVEFTRPTDGQVFNLYVSTSINYDVTKNNYPYGYTISYNSGAYTQITSGRLNMTVKGFCGGLPWMGHGGGLNQSSGSLENSQGYPEYMCRNIEDMNTIGAYWLRQDVYLDTDNFNRDAWDIFFNQSEQRNQGGIVAILKPGDHAATWNWVNTEDFNKDANDMADRAKALAERYKGYHIIWEIMNEPNECNDAYSGCIYMDKYADLVRIISKKIKEADPNAWVGAGSLSHYSYWMSDKTLDKGMGNDIDFYTYHPYWQPFPEINGLCWSMSRKYKFTSLSTTNTRPIMLSSEFGCAHYTYPETGNTTESSTFLYRVWESGSSPSLMMASNKRWGQTFKISSAAINNISINLANVTYTADKLKCSLYLYSGIESNPKNGQSPLLEVAATSVASYGTAFFNLSTVCPLLGKRQKYYVEFYRTDGGNVELYYNNGNKYISNDYLNFDGYSEYDVLPHVDFDGKAYSTDVQNNLVMINHGYGTVFDLNMIVGNGGNTGEGKIAIPQVTSYPNTTSTLESLKAITIARNILFQMQEGVAASLIYKQAGDFTSDTWGIFNWAPQSPFALPKNTAAYAMKNIWQYFGNAHNSPKFMVEAWGADLNYVAKEDDNDGSLIIAVWQNLPTSNLSTVPVSVWINSPDYVNGVVNVITNTCSQTMGAGSGFGLTRTQGKDLLIYNLQVGVQPVFIKVKR